MLYSVYTTTYKHYKPKNEIGFSKYNESTEIYKFDFFFWEGRNGEKKCNNFECIINYFSISEIYLKNVLYRHL